jgi:hypothetical protein
MTPPTVGEALSQRPGEVGQMKEGRKLEEIHQEVGAQAAQTQKPPSGMLHFPDGGPSSLVGKPVPAGQPAVPNTQVYREAAATAETMMGQHANSWEQVLRNMSQARTDLLVKVRESARIEGAGREEAMNAYRALADGARLQQEKIIRAIYPPQRAEVMIGRLKTASDNYRKAVMAGGEDMIQTIANGGPKGRETLDAVNELTKNDPLAKKMIDALVHLHHGSGGKASQAGGLFGAAYLASHIPGIGHTVAAVLSTLGAVRTYKLINAHLASLGSGRTVKMEDLIKTRRPNVISPGLRRMGAGFGQQSLQGTIQGIGQ